MRTIVILIFLCGLLPNLLTAQTNSKFFGMLLNIDDTIAVEDVHVLNVSKRLGTTSNKDGIFRISANINDSIIFSVLGFEYDMLVIDSCLLAEEINPYFMRPKIYQLPDVYVWPYLTYAEFKQAIIDFDHKKYVIDVRIPKTEIMNTDALANPGITLGGPITALYNAFSKEGKELKKYQELIERDNFERFLASKYNENIVSKITGIKNTEKLYVFMDYCNLSEAFIIHSKEYDIYLAILQCYDRYTKEQSN